MESMTGRLPVLVARSPIVRRFNLNIAMNCRPWEFLLGASIIAYHEAVNVLYKIKKQLLQCLCDECTASTQVRETPMPLARRVGLIGGY